MTTLLALKQELDNIREEIEVLIEEDARLIKAAREETSQSTNGDSMTNFFETDDWPAEDTKECKHPAKEGIFVDKSIDKIVTKAKKTRKQTYFSQASKIVAKPFLLKQTKRKTSSSPPPLLLAATFDTEPRSIFDDEEHDFQRGYRKPPNDDGPSSDTRIFANVCSGHCDHYRRAVSVPREHKADRGTARAGTLAVWIKLRQLKF